MKKLLSVKWAEGFEIAMYINSHKFIKWIMGWKYILQSFQQFLILIIGDKTKMKVVYSIYFGFSQKRNLEEVSFCTELFKKCS
jgi:hypothetical protein